MAASGVTPTTIPGSPPTARGKRRVLILGGTAEARDLAGLLTNNGYEPVTSLAGITQSPADRAGETRKGGFGGAQGLAEFTAAEGFCALIDATHPFALRISNYAEEAARLSGLPLLRLERAAWAPEPGDRWTEVANNLAASSAVPSGARVLLTIGRKEVSPYFARTDITGIARMIEAPEPFQLGSSGAELEKGLAYISGALPDRQSRATLAGSAVDIKVTDNWRVLLARPPFSLKDELGLLSDNAISHLVAKNSGGEETKAKLVAARMRGVEVVLIKRPDKPRIPTVADAGAVLPFLQQVVSA
jgi:precorrin-6A/cobalt-precorrin-6A reductase